MIEDTETTAPEVTPEVAPEVVVEAPVEVAEKPKLTVRRVKSAAPVIAESKDDADASVAPEGTRTETDAGPVQGTNFLAEPREIEEIETAGGLVIQRVRY